MGDGHSKIGGIKIKTIYIVIDKETWTNVAVGFTEKQIMEQTMKQDIYFATDQDFYENFEDRYTVETWEYVVKL